MKKVLTPIVICFIISVLFVCLLYAISNKINNMDNGFVRVFPPHRFLSVKELNIKYNSYYIAGLSSTNIYLANSTAPLFLLTLDYNLKDTHNIKYRTQNNISAKWGALNTKTDSSNIYMMEGDSPTFLIGSLTNNLLEKLNEENLSKSKFSASLPLSNSSFILRTYDSSLRQSILIKKTLGKHNINNKLYKLEKQVDGYFCTDGMLHYNRELSEIIYLYYYRNQYLILDTNLNLLFKGKTIDTISKAQIKVSYIPSHMETTMSGVPLIVNKKSSTSGDWLFIYSRLRSTKESKKTFEDNSVIDLYSLSAKKYKFSIYLPKEYNREKLSDFKAHDNVLVALYGPYLVIYKLNLK